MTAHVVYQRCSGCSHTRPVRYAETTVHQARGGWQWTWRCRCGTSNTKAVTKWGSEQCRAKGARLATTHPGNPPDGPALTPDDVLDGALTLQNVSTVADLEGTP